MSDFRNNEKKMSDLKKTRWETSDLKKTGKAGKNATEIHVNFGLTLVARGGSVAIAACRAPKAESSGEDPWIPRATGGLVSNLPHPRVNETKQHTNQLHHPPIPPLICDRGDST